MGTAQWNFTHGAWQHSVRYLLVVAGLAGFLTFNSLAAAQEAPDKSAHEFAKEVKDELVSVIRSKQELEQEGGPDQYVAAIRGVLEPVVDFDYIARGVMGQHAQKASPEQRERFAEVFKRSLVNTYARGLAAYGEYDITVVPPEEDVSGKRTVGVWLKVSNGDTTHRLAFTTKLNRDGQWKVTNMILNGVNLGKAFRGQFENAMNQNQGDIDATIANWTV